MYVLSPGSIAFNTYDEVGVDTMLESKPALH